MPERVMESLECRPVTLEPFIHQVGGHSSMLRFDERTVCKPLISREHHFYQSMPTDMKEFTPQYRGVAEVIFEEDSDGYVTLVAYPIDPKSGSRTTTPASSSPSSGGDTGQSDSDGENTEPSSSSSPGPQARSSRSRQRFRLKRSGSIELESKMKPYSASGGPEESLDNGRNPYGLNQWQLRCHKKTIDKLRKSSQGSGPHKFMLLENLICHFKLPCVLDLKMGTRQHGDDATEAKRDKHTRKCEATTSGKLGARLCGMQVYQANSSKYICQDKYYGRKVSEKGFQDTLAQFLHNGYCLRTDIMDCIVHRLKRLREMLSKQNTFRFYSSSLLIMYDGADWDPFDQEADDNSSVSSVSDLESPTASHASDSSCSQGCDAGGATASEEPCGSQANGNNGKWNELRRACSQSPPKMKKTSHSSRRPRVDVRMIDFAHVTHQGFRGDRIVHSGPDHGYLLGLQNLISMFQKIKERNRNADSAQ